MLLYPFSYTLVHPAVLAIRVDESDNSPPYAFGPATTVLNTRLYQPWLDVDAANKIAVAEISITGVIQVVSQEERFGVIDTGHLPEIAAQQLCVAIEFEKCDNFVAGMSSEVGKSAIHTGQTV